MERERVPAPGMEVTATQSIEFYSSKWPWLIFVVVVQMGGVPSRILLNGDVKTCEKQFH